MSKSQAESTLRVLVTGGTGLVGQRLLPRLRERGYHVIVISRQFAPKLPPGCLKIEADPVEDDLWLNELDRIDVVINLAGENLFARRWSKRFKNKLYDSRIETTRQIANRLALHPLREDGTPKLLISGSAVGYYGPHGSEELDEDSPPGKDFLANLCVDWERVADPARAAGVRVVHPRIGMVLDSRGGALVKMARPFRWFVGGPIGSGKQWISWIHIADLVAMIMFAIDRPEVEGPINATAPEPITNWGFSKMLASELRRPCWLTVPWLGARVLLGEVATTVFSGQRVMPRKAQRLRYPFRFPDLEPALQSLLQRNVADEKTSTPAAPS